MKPPFDTALRAEASTMTNPSLSEMKGIEGQPGPVSRNCVERGRPSYRPRLTTRTRGSSPMRSSPSLVLVVHVPGRASCNSAGNGVVMRIVTGDSAHEGTLDASLALNRGSREESCGKSDHKSGASRAHFNSPRKSRPMDFTNAAAVALVRLNLNRPGRDETLPPPSRAVMNAS